MEAAHNRVERRGSLPRCARLVMNTVRDAIHPSAGRLEFANPGSSI